MSEETILTPADTTQAQPTAEAAPEQTESTEEKTLAESEIQDSGDKKTDAEESKPVTPEKYEVKMPEGMELDQGMLDTFSPIFKELGLSQEQVQKLADTYVPLIQSSEEKTRQKAMADYKQITDGWRAETEKDLGANKKTELAFAGRAIQKFGGPELRELLANTGVGNHKALVSFCAKVGKTISEDAFVQGNSSANQDPLNIMYPSMKQ